LTEARVVHGDLQHGNVLWVPGSNERRLALKLVDYDGMGVPELAGLPMTEQGHEAFQHPQREQARAVNPQMDRFSHLVIYGALRCLMVGSRQLWERYHDGNNLLFKKQDFCSPGESELLKELWRSEERELRSLAGHVVRAVCVPLEQVPPLDVLLAGEELRPLTEAERRQVQDRLKVPEGQGIGKSLAPPPAEPVFQILGEKPAGADIPTAVLSGERMRPMHEPATQKSEPPEEVPLARRVIRLSPRHPVYNKAERRTDPFLSGLFRRPGVLWLLAAAAGCMTFLLVGVTILTWISKGSPDPQGAVPIARPRLSDLPEYDWAVLLPWPPQPFPDNRPLELPQRFVLTGELAAVRIYEGKTWVYLGPGSLARSGMRPDRMLMGSPVSPLCAIELENSGVAEGMVDYQIGQSIRVVVQRQDWVPPPGCPPPFLPPGVRIPRGAFRQFQSPLRERDRAAMEAEVLLAPFRQFQPGVGPAVVTYCCFRGEGLEMKGQPQTWIDVRQGRINPAPNEATLRQSPGFLYRNLRGNKDRSISLTAEYVRVLKPGPGHNTLVTLTIPQSIEGPIPVFAYMGSAVQMDEFFDYARGASVSAEVSVAAPPVPVALASPYPRDPLTAWIALTVTCKKIQLQGQPATVVRADGPRRSRSSVVIGPSPPPPPMPPALPQYQPGQEVTCKGQLVRCRGQDGESHFVVFGAMPGVLYVEAFTKAKDFMTQVADYVDREESSSGADTVQIKGTVVAPEAARLRLQTGALLVQLQEIERPGVNGSLAVPGKQREESTFPSDRPRVRLATILRDPPPVGTVVKFQALYSSYLRTGQTVHLRSSRENYRTIAIRYPGGNPKMFEGWRFSSPVEVTAVVDKPPADPADDRFLVVTDIVNLNQKPGRELICTGQLRRCQGRDGESHFVVYVRGSLLEEQYVEAVTREKDFMAQVADFVDKEESSRDADTVQIKGTVSAPEAVHFRLQTDALLVQLQQIERPGDAGSLAIVGKQREARTFRQDRPRTRLAVILRDPPPVGTEVKFQAIYSSYSRTRQTVHLRRDKNDYRSIDIPFAGIGPTEFEGLRAGDPVEVTATIATAPVGSVPNRVLFASTSIARVGFPTPVASAPGQEVPLDFTRDKEEWDQFVRQGGRTTSRRLIGCGIFDGWTSTSSISTARKTQLNINISCMYFADGNLVLFTRVSPEAETFLSGLTKGEKVLFEFGPVRTKTKPSGPTRTATAESRAMVYWMSRLDKPDAKVTFPLTTSRTK
jgi:hypothetical protein